jgi:hypothetical protein
MLRSSMPDELQEMINRGQAAAAKAAPAAGRK